MEEYIQPCEVCGGTNFELVLGYYHCSECQTRKQGVQEHEIDEHDEKLQGLLNTKTVIKKQTEVLEKVKLTTWECYNYVIKGLVEELLILGADLLLRSVVKKLWFRYLLQLEVINLEKPKLQAVNTKIDAEIVYGRKKKRKKRTRRSSTADFSSVGSMCSSREFNKKRKRLMNSQHDYSLSQSVDNSLMDGTLDSLKNASDKTSQSSFPLQFNKYAENELRRRQSEKHLRKHSKDVENELTCHRNSYRGVSKKYQNSCQLLSINKIYSILHLGLLLTKSKIQLGDMIRFIREGHLSFNNFKHFFPQEMGDNFITKIFPKKSCFTSASLRESTFQMAKFLNVLDFVETQNLALLIERYCKELNLPEIIEKRTLSSLVVTLPKMKITEKITLIPNYEARALSLILFQIKLFFSIDGKTEKYLSDHAKILNEGGKLKMFDFMEWLQFIYYRQHILKKHHFPTEFASDKQMKNSDSFLKFLIDRNPEYEKGDIDQKFNEIANDCRQLLTKLKERQSNIEEANYFKPSFTPSMEYVEILLQNHCVTGEVERIILSRNFQNCSMDYILKPSEFIDLVPEEKRIEIKLGGINENVRLDKLINLDTERTKKLKEDRKFSVVKLGETSKDTECQQQTSLTEFDTSSDDYLKNYEDFHDFSSRMEEIRRTLHKANSNDDEPEKRTFIQVVPYESHWVNTHCNLGLLSKETFEEHLDTYPYHFQFILKEMARICEQNVQEFLEEFMLTEVFLLYGETYQSDENCNNYIIKNDNLMKKIVTKSVKNW